MNKQLFPLLAVNFISSLGFSIVLPFLVFLVDDFGGNGVIYGIMAATYPALQLIGAPLLGRSSDIHGRKRILLISQTGTLVSWIVFLTALYIPVTALASFDSSMLGVFILTWPLLILFLARALDGLTAGNISVTNAYISDISTPKDRKSYYGKLSISSNLGFIIGPALAGLLAATSLESKLPVMAAILISVIGLIVIRMWLPESTKKQPNSLTPANSPKRGIKDVMRIKNVPYFLLLYFLIFLGFNFFYTAFPLHALVSLKWDEIELGIFFSFLSLCMALVQGPFLSYLSRYSGDAILVILGSITLATNFVLIALGLEWLVYPAGLLFAVGNGIMWPSFLSLLSKSSEPNVQGTIQGIATSVGSLASIIGLLAGGFLYDQVGPWTFGVAAGVIYLVFLLSFRLIGIEKS